MARAAWLAASLMLAACLSDQLPVLAQRPPAVPSCDGQGKILRGVIEEYSAAFNGPIFPGLPAYVLDVGCSNYAQDWNIATQWTIKESQLHDYPPRPLALVHLAQWQALLLNNASGSPANDNFLVAYVSHNVLLSLQPQHAVRYDALLARQVAGFPRNGLVRARAAADAVAATLLAARADDGSQSSSLYEPAPPGGPHGVFQAIRWPGLPPGPHLAQFAAAVAFVMPRNHTQVGLTAPPPEPARSPGAQAQLRPVRLQGGRNSTARTANQTETALWWSEWSNTSGCIGHWNQIALATMRPGTTLQRSVQLLAQINVASYDAFVAVFADKFRWVRWRPVTAIRRGNCQPGDAPDACEQPEPSWAPLLATPNYPSYPGWRGACGGPAELILTREHGANRSFTIGSETVTADGPLPRREFQSFTQACLDAVDARVWGGAQTSAGSLAGRSLTRQVAEYVVSRFDKLDPLSPSAAPEWRPMAAAFSRALRSAPAR